MFRLLYKFIFSSGKSWNFSICTLKSLRLRIISFPLGITVKTVKQWNSRSWYMLLEDSEIYQVALVQVLLERDIQHPQQEDLQLLPLSIVSATVVSINFRGKKWTDILMGDLCVLFVCFSSLGSFVSVVHLLVGVVYCLISWAVGLPKRAVSPRSPIADFPYELLNSCLACKLWMLCCQHIFSTYSHDVVGPDTKMIAAYTGTCLLMFHVELLEEQRPRISWTQIGESALWA